MRNRFFRFVFVLLLGAAFLPQVSAQKETVSHPVTADAKWYADAAWYRKTQPPKPKRAYDAFGREIEPASPDTAAQKVLNDPTPDPVVNLAEFAAQYRANPNRWDSAFRWLRYTDLASLPAGRYPIDGDDVYATISEGPPKLIDTTEWESHRNFEDIHYVIAGKETIGIIPVGEAKLLRPYDQAKDLASYSAKGKYYTGDPGRFYIVTTKEAHRPGLKAEGCDHLKKLYIKVRKS